MSIVTLMVFMILVGSFKDVVTFLSFKVNQDYIASFLCINKDLPQSTCNGKCVLMQSIANNHEQEESSTIPPLTENKENLICTLLDQGDTSSVDILLIRGKIFLPHQRIIGNKYISDVFHPPQVG